MADHASAHGEVAHHEHEEAHATNQTYVRVAIILAIITFVEVVIWYVPTVRPLLVPALIVLSLAKFLMVVGFFMHLKYDHRIFRFMFFAGLVITLGVYLAMLAMFWTAHYFAPLSPA
jgi:cytochrome c oxidase subunit 4